MPVRLWVAAVALLAACLRLPTLDVQGYWVDEAATIAVVGRPWPDLLAAVAASESTPPLYYLLAKAWSVPFGLGEVGVRSLSAVLGVLPVPVVAALARRVAGPRAAVAAALLVAVSPLLWWMSQEARAYGLLTLLVPLGVLALLRALEAPRPGRLLAWGLLALAAIATHWFALFLVAPQVVLVLAVGVRRRAAWFAAAVPVLGGAALLPLLLGQREAARAVFIGSEPLGRRLLQVPKQFLVGYDAPAEAALTAVSGVAALVALAGVLALLRRGTAPAAGREERGAPVPPSSRPPEHAGGGEGAASDAAAAPAPTRASRLARGRGALLVVVATAACGLLLPVLLELLGQPYVLGRNLLGALPLLLAVLGAGLASVPSRPAAALATAALVLGGLAAQVGVVRDADLQRDEWRAALRAVGPASGPRLVIVNPADAAPVLRLYLPGARVPPVGTATYVEIVTVDLASRRGGGTRTAPVRPAQSPNGAFAYAGERVGRTWRTVRWRAAAPAPLEARFFSRAGLLVRVQP